MTVAPEKTGATASHHSHLEEVVPTLRNLPDSQLTIVSTSDENLLSRTCRSDLPREFTPKSTE